MTRVSQIPVVISTSSAGAGTVSDIGPISGFLVEFRAPNGATAISSATADWLIVRQSDGGTLLSLPNTIAPFQVFPARRLTTEAGGTTAYAVGVGPVVQAGVPVDDAVRVSVAQAGTVAASGTVYLVVEGFTGG